MQEFFKSELETLAIKTGVAQAELLIRDCQEKSQAIEIINTVTLQWAQAACDHSFSVIPTATKKRIIQEQIIKDDAFIRPPYGQLPGFNCRIIWKWLNNHMQLHGDILAKKAEQKVEQQGNPAPPEVADKYLNQLKEMLVGGNVKNDYKDIDSEMARIRLEDQERLDGKKPMRGFKPNPEYVLLLERKAKAIKSRGWDKLELNQVKTFEIEGQVIIAPSEDDAREFYMEVFV